MSVFSDERVIDALKDFVSVVQDTSLQNHPVDDELSKFFRKAIRNGSHLELQNINDFSFDAVKPSRHGVTTQGLYMFNAAGDSYGGLNTNNGVEAVLQVLTDAKRAFDESPPETLTDLDYIASTTPTLPEGAIIVRTFTRITPVPIGCSDVNKMVGRDHLWVLRSEVNALSRGEVPDSFAYRIVRHHLVDNIRGEPGKWNLSHVKELNIKADRVESGGEIRVKLSGNFSLLSPEGFGKNPGGDPLPERGYAGTIEGELVMGSENKEIHAFRMLADGQHWGVSKNNAVGVPEGKYPLKIAFVLAESDLTRAVPPHGIRRWRSSQEDYFGMSLEDISIDGD